MRSTYGAWQVFGRAGLGHITQGAAVEGPRDVDRILVHAENEYPGGGPARDDATKRFDAADIGQRDVEHDNVGCQLAIHAQRLRGCRCLTNDHEFGIALEQAPIPLTHYRVIVHQQHCDHVVAPTGM
jgi:hypothetical protein